MKINTAATDRKILYGLIISKTIRTDCTLFVIFAGHILTFIKPIFQTVGLFNIICKLEIIRNNLREYGS